MAVAARDRAPDPGSLAATISCSATGPKYRRIVILAEPRKSRRATSVDNSAGKTALGYRRR
jgi:hypothetical protein